MSAWVISETPPTAISIAVAPISAARSSAASNDALGTESVNSPRSIGDRSVAQPAPCRAPTTVALMRYRRTRRYRMIVGTMYTTEIAVSRPQSTWFR